VESHLTSRRVEETVRFIKPSHQFEYIRLLTHECLRNTAALVTTTPYFACVHLGKNVKLQILVQHLQQTSKRIYGIPEFRFYALPDGIK